MLIKREVLLDELNQFKNIDESIYVGKIDDIKCDYFDLDNLFVARLIHFCEGANEFKKSDFKYVLERKCVLDKIVYREVFSGAELERIDLMKALSSRGIYVFEPIPYSFCIVNNLSLCDNTEESKNILKRVRLQA